MGRHPQSTEARRRDEKLTVSSSIESLPTELVLEVLSRVAASSLKDLFNLKLSCRDYCALCDDKMVLKRMSLKKFPVIPWTQSEKASGFFNKCKESGNPEALYRQGLVDFFSKMRVESGIDSLTKAASHGHVGAVYTMGIIFILLGAHGDNDEFKQRGMKLLASTTRKLRATRREVKECLSQMWIRNGILRDRPVCCALRDQHRRRRRRLSWGENEEDDEDGNVQYCEACRCDEEVDAICKVLHNV